MLTVLRPKRVLDGDDLLSALAKKQQTHSTKTNKQTKDLVEGELTNAPIGPLECSQA